MNKKVKVGDKGSVTLRTREVTYSEVMLQLKFLQGTVLTIVDASITEDRHNKATKDLINNAFYAKMDNVWNLCHPHDRAVPTDEIKAAEQVMGQGEKKVTPDEIVEVEVIEKPIK